MKQLISLSLQLSGPVAETECVVVTDFEGVGFGEILGEEWMSPVKTSKAISNLLRKLSMFLKRVA